MSLEIDFNEVEDVQDFTPLPEGTYAMRCSKCTIEVGKDSGTPYFNLELTVEAPTQFKSKALKRVVLSTSEGALKFMKGYLKAAFHSNSEALGKVTLSPELFYGTKVNAYVEIEQVSNNGKIYNNNIIKPWNYSRFDEGSAGVTANPSPTNPLPPVLNKLSI